MNHSGFIFHIKRVHGSLLFEKLVASVVERAQSSKSMDASRLSIPGEFDKNDKRSRQIVLR
jgi:hypothetical protein